MVRKGQKYERKLRDQLMELPQIVTVSRSAGSKNLDLIALFKKRVVIFEVKSTSKDVVYPSKDAEQFEILLNLPEATDYILEKYYAVWFLNRGWEFFKIDENLKRCKIGEGIKWNSIMSRF